MVFHGTENGGLGLESIENGGTGWNRLRTVERAGIERRIGKGKKGKREKGTTIGKVKKVKREKGGIRKNEYFLFEF